MSWVATTARKPLSTAHGRLCNPALPSRRCLLVGRRGDSAGSNAWNATTPASDCPRRGSPQHGGQARRRPAPQKRLLHSARSRPGQGRCGGRAGLRRQHRRNRRRQRDSFASPGRHRSSRALPPCIPSPKGEFVLLDSGASVECRPNNLLTFRHHGEHLFAGNSRIQEPARRHP